MKNLLILSLLFLYSYSLTGQVPKTINYQAVARNNSGQALANQTIQIRLSIMSGATSLYSETRSLTTNALGLFNVKIGSPGAIATTGDFTIINWTNNQPEVKLIKVELDINNTNSFTDMGSQALATVPYAFSASTAINAINIGGNYVDTNIPQLNDVLKWEGNAWVASSLPPAPVIIPIAESYVGNIPPGGAGAPWTFASAAQQTITVVDGQTIAASLSFNLEPYGSASNNPISADICYQQVVNGVPTGSIYAFSSDTYPDYAIDKAMAYSIGINCAASGAVKVMTGTAIPTKNQIPPGTYKVFLGIKNKSTINQLYGESVNGFIQVFNN